MKCQIHQSVINLFRKVCPYCSNLLIISRTSIEHSSENSGGNRFECRTCPYQYPIKNKRKFHDRKELKTKEVDDIIGGKDSWENVDQIDVICPNERCDSKRAFWYALQIRSADEPMTNFHKCIQCATQWRD